VSGPPTNKISASGIFPDKFLSKIADGVSQVDVERACIFGSAVEKGLAARDIDLLLISPEFSGVHFLSRKDMVTLPESHHFDIRPYTHDEFNQCCPRGHPFRESLEEQAIEILDGTDK